MLRVVNRSWPREIEQGLIPTDDAMGIMTEELSPAAKGFVTLAASATSPLLEIGAAYGNATLPALEAGATVIANDLSPTELAVLAQTAGDHRRHLVTVPASFPSELRLGECSLGGVLAAQVLHFFDGPAVEQSFQAVYRWLEPGGRFFVLVMTPSLSCYHALWPEFEERLKRGERWPGIFDPRTVAPPDWKDRLPPMVHLFDKNILRRCCEEAGFAVESLEYFCFKRFPDKHRTDGREYVTLTARKPL